MLEKKELFVEYWGCPNCGDDTTTTAYDDNSKRYCEKCRPPTLEDYLNEIIRLAKHGDIMGAEDIKQELIECLKERT